MEKIQLCFTRYSAHTLPRRQKEERERERGGGGHQLNNKKRMEKVKNAVYSRSQGTLKV